MNKISQFFTHNLYNLFLVGSLSSYLYIAFFIYEMPFYDMLPRICSFIVLFLVVNFYHLSPWLKKTSRWDQTSKRNGNLPLEK